MEIYVYNYGHVDYMPQTEKVLLKCLKHLINVILIKNLKRIKRNVY